MLKFVNHKDQNETVRKGTTRLITVFLTHCYRIQDYLSYQRRARMGRSNISQICQDYSRIRILETSRSLCGVSNLFEESSLQLTILTCAKKSKRLLSYVRIQFEKRINFAMICI